MTTNNLKDTIIKLKSLNKASERIIKSKYPEIYQDIISRTSYLGACKFNERIYHIINDMYSRPICPTCNTNACEWFYDYFRYKQCCSHECFLKCPDRINKIKNTLEAKFGGTSAFCSEEVRKKSADTVMRVYQTDNVMRVQEIRDKQRKSNKNKSGFENNFANPEIIQKREESNLKKYGVKNVFSKGWKRDEIIKGLISKYGTDNINKSLISKESRELLENEEWLSDALITKKLPLYEVARQLDCDPTTVSNWAKKFNIDISDNKQSYIESKLYDAISNVYKHTIIRHDRNLISPLELDLLFPEHKLAIEVCGLYWHSEKFKDKNYHYNKMRLCQESGYRLLTIYEDEIQQKFDIVLRAILHKLNCSQEESIYARKTVLKIVDRKEKKLFLDAHHIQGDDKSTRAYGLFYNDKLVAVCSVQINAQGCLISRYATSCKVIGGFSKLLKKIKSDFSNLPIYTFADLRWSDGGLYQKNNMIKNGVVGISYDYIIKDKRFHKFNFRKANIIRKYGDKVSSDMTERQMCQSLGILRIYDCGKLKFTL